MNPTFFHTASVFRQWLETNHATATELWVGYFKTNSGQPSLTWPQSVDEALCFGWIDGLRKSIDAWTFFQAQPPSYRKTATWWIVSAKTEATRLKRLQKLIANSSIGHRL